MNSFEKINFEKPEDRIIRNIFPTDGRKGFHKKVKEVLEWSKKGGPRKGTPLFIKGVAGSVEFGPRDFLIFKKAIGKEVSKIEADKKGDELQRIRMKPKENEYKEISQEARKYLSEELKRSGGIDPNEI